MITNKGFYTRIFIFAIFGFFLLYFMFYTIVAEQKEKPKSEYVFTKNKIYRVTEDWKCIEVKQSDLEYLKSRIIFEEVKQTVSEMDSIRILINNKY